MGTVCIKDLPDVSTKFGAGSWKRLVYKGGLIFKLLQ